MLDLCKLIFGAMIDLLRSWATLEAEIVVLRQQINVLRRANPNRHPFGSTGWSWEGVCRLFPKLYDALAIVRPDTVIRWHRAGFRLYWRWKSRRRCGRPTVPLEVRRVIRQLSIANPLWGAPRIHGELLKLGIEIGQTSVAKYLARRRGPPSQGWKTFLRNHADGIAAMDLFVVPTISFRLLYGLLIMGHGRRQILWLGVTVHQRPNGSPISWRRRVAGSQSLVTWSGTAMAPTAGYSCVGLDPSVFDSPRSPWQNAYAERLIGSIRRECIDHVVVFGERHLRHVLLLYKDYYNPVS
jgi:hypothetical protein